MITDQLNNLYVIETIGANNKRFIKKVAESIGLIFVDLTEGHPTIPTQDEADVVLSKTIKKINSLNMADRYCFYGAPELMSIIHLLYGNTARAMNCAGACELNFQKGRFMFLESAPEAGLAGLRKLKRKDKSLKIFEKSDVDYYNRVVGEFIASSDESLHVLTADKTNHKVMADLILTTLNRENEVEL